MPDRVNARTWKHIAWLPLNAAVIFLLPILLINVLSLSRNVFYVLLTVIAAGIVWYYTRSTELNFSAWLSPGWALGIILGVFIGLTFISLASLSLPALPANLFLQIASIQLWLIVLYGLASGILISVFPFMITWRALAGANPGNFRKLTITVVALIAIGATSFLYNFGMLGDQDIRERMTKSLIASVPTLLSGSPLATPISSVFLQLSENALALDKTNTKNAGLIETARSKADSGGIN